MNVSSQKPRRCSRQSSFTPSTAPNCSAACRRASSGAIPAAMFAEVCCSMWKRSSSFASCSHFLRENELIYTDLSAGLTRSSFIAQRNIRIHAHRAPGGDVASGERDAQQGDRDRRKRERIGGSHLIQETFHRTRHHPRRQKTNRNSQRG